MGPVELLCHGYGVSPPPCGGQTENIPSVILRMRAVINKETFSLIVKRKQFYSMSSITMQTHLIQKLRTNKTAVRSRPDRQ